MQRGSRVIHLQGAIEKSPILLSQYGKNEWLDGTIIISYFGGSNNMFADCKLNLTHCVGKLILVAVKTLPKNVKACRKLYYFYHLYCMSQGVI